MPSLSQLAEIVVELCHEAGVEYGFAQPHMKEAILEQADVLSSELASSLRVKHHFCGSVASSLLLCNLLLRHNRSSLSNGDAER